MSNLWRGFGHALRGLGAALGREPNFRIEVVAALVVIIAGFWLKLEALEWVVILLCIGTVLAAELFNTAIELIIDAVSPEKNDWAAKAKDISAGAVLVTAIVSAIIGVIIFGRHLL